MLFSALSYPFSFFLCCSIQDLISLFYAVFTSYWHMEYRLHFCGDLNWEAFVSWKKCGPPVGFDDWSPGHAISRYYFTGMIYYLWKYWDMFNIKHKLLLSLKCFCSFVYRFEMRKQGGIWAAWGGNSQYPFQRSSPMQILRRSNSYKGF